MRISDLPDGLLVDVADYLHRPSRAFLAIALTAPSWEWSELKSVGQASSVKGREIISASRWDILDFEEIEKSLANKLDDDDLHAILVCIDAKNRLTQLKLTHCMSIVGMGLKPLCGSTAIGKIDISLVGQNQSPRIDPEPSLCDEVVVPILCNIIGERNSMVKHIQFPLNFREGRSDVFDHFLQQYNQYLEDKQLKCAKCGEQCLGTGSDEIDHAGKDMVFRDREQDDWYGIQNYTCHKCMNNYCGDCETEGEQQPMMGLCSECETIYCHRCSSFEWCEGCNYTICKECESESEDWKETECTGCHEPACTSCLNTCSYCNVTQCEQCRPTYGCGWEGCETLVCKDCFDKKAYEFIYCEECEEYLCTKCSTASIGCPSCEEIAVLTKKIEENKKLLQESERKIERLEREKEKLERQVEDESRSLEFLRTITRARKRTLTRREKMLCSDSKRSKTAEK